MKANGSLPESYMQAQGCLCHLKHKTTKKMQMDAKSIKVDLETEVK